MIISAYPACLRIVRFWSQRILALYRAGRQADALRDIAANRWGQGESIEWYLPSRVHSARAVTGF